MPNKNETVLITGASTGIGRAVARAFLNRDYNLVLNSRDPGRLEAAYESLGRPDDAVLVAGDVSDKAVGQRMVDAALEKFGRVDVLVNNAGIFSPKPFLDVEEADLDRYYAINLKGTYFASQAAIFSPKPFLDVEEADLDRYYAINLKGTYFASQAAIPAMQAQGGGSIINIGTVLVDHAIGGFPASAAVASKGAVHALTLQLAAEFGTDNIRVNTVAPGIVRTPIHARNGIENVDDLAGLSLLNRVGEGEEAADAILHLATAKSAGHHFG
jgi:NAD(P)-dependent dehydrogenase (short-subunit alcohol dehydrogenase family)